MSTLDYIILIGYLLATMAAGLLFKARRRGFEDFSIAGRSVKWWPMGLSVMATAFSVVNFTAFPEEALRHGLYVWLVFPALVLAGAITCFAIIPFYHRFQPVSAYEFMERRFDSRVRRLTAAVFILWRVAWMCIVLYAAGAVIGAATGLSFWLIVLICSLASVIYTAAGGLRAIIKTDVLQFLVISAGIITALFLVVRNQDAAGILQHAVDAGRLRPFVPYDESMWSLDPFLRMSFWSCMIGGTVVFLTRYGVDQVVVQRYFAARSLRDAQIGFALNIVLLAIALVALTFLGLAVGDQMMPAAGARGTGKFLGQFIASLPNGVVGLIVAGLFASVMSSLDSAMHSCATSVITDFVSRPGVGAPDAAVVRLVRQVTILLLLLAVLMTVVVRRFGTIFEVSNKIVNALGSPILALFVLGWIRGLRLSSRGVFIGGLLGVAWSMYASFFVKGLALHYYAFVNFGGTLLLAGCLGLALRDSRDRVTTCSK